VSALGWIVGSLQERDAALELLRGEGEAEPRDELGVGVLRDALAEAFFPGVTTLQTRAKYFLLVPRMYQEIEDAGSRVSAARRIRDLEAELLERLRGTGERGVIGSQRWRVPHNPASGIYWSGLYTWRIRLFRNTRAHYHRWLDGGRRRPLLSSSDDVVTADARWHEPPEAADLLEERHLRLRRSHAEFLRDRILGLRDRPDRSLLKDFVAAGPFPEGVMFWQLPTAHGAALAELARDAERLATALRGAMLLYNRRCAELKDATTLPLWRERLHQWSVDYPEATWREWDLDAFWERVQPLDGGRAQFWTEPFLAPWVAELRNRGPETPTALRLVVDREQAVKPGRARTAGAASLDTWKPESGVAAQPLSFRWPEARTILNDIHAGLNSG
jgi:hypothetical protein